MNGDPNMPPASGSLNFFSPSPQGQIQGGVGQPLQQKQQQQQPGAPPNPTSSYNNTSFPNAPPTSSSGGGGGGGGNQAVNSPLPPDVNLGGNFPASSPLATDSKKDVFQNKMLSPSFSGPSTAPSSQNSDPLLPVGELPSEVKEEPFTPSVGGKNSSPYPPPSCETNPGSSTSIPAIPSPLPIVKMEPSEEPFIPGSVGPGKGNSSPRPTPNSDMNKRITSSSGTDNHNQKITSDPLLRKGRFKCSPTHLYEGCQ